MSLAFCGLLAACGGTAGVDAPVSNGAGPTGVAELSWMPPTEHTDGTTLYDLSGYKIYIGTAEGSYTELIDLLNPELTMYVVDNLASGTYFFVITAYNSAGVESDYSNVISKTINVTSNTVVGSPISVGSAPGAIAITPEGNLDSIEVTADAGSNQPIRVGETVNLYGSVPADTATPSFVADVPGTFAVQPVVEDEAGNFNAPDTVEISSGKLAPEANAGDDQVVIIATAAVFDGTGSSDGDFEPLSFNWTIASAPTGSMALLVGSTTATPSLTPDLEGIYTVDLVVNDGFAGSVPDSVLVTAVTGEEFAETELMDANDVITEIPVEGLDAPEHSNSLTNMVAQIIDSIQKRQYPPATHHKLDNAIERTDGCALRGAVDPMGGGTSRIAGDWVTDCTEQADLYALLISAKAALEM